MAESGRIAKNTIFLYIRFLFVLLVSLYTSRVVLQALGVVDYGLYNVIGGIVSMLSFINGTAAGATSRYLTFALGAKNRHLYNFRKLFSAAFFIHMAIALLIVLLAETVGVWYFYHGLSIPVERMTAGMWVLQLSIFSCLVSFTQVPYNASIIAHERMKVYAYVGVFEALGKLTIAFLISVSPIDHLIVYSWLIFIVTLAISLFYRVYCVRSFGDDCRLQMVRGGQEYRMLLGYSAWDFIGNFGVIARNQGVNLLLNFFFGPSVNAARAITTQVENGLNSFLGNFQTAVRPSIIKHYAAGEIERMLRLFYLNCEFSCLLYSVLAVPICFEADAVLHFWLVNPPQETTIFLQLTIITYMASSINGAIGIGVHAVGDVRRLNLFAGTSIFPEMAVIGLLLRGGYPACSAFFVMCIASYVIMWMNIYVMHKNISAVTVTSFLRHVVIRVLTVLILPLSAVTFLEQVLSGPFLLRMMIVCLVYWGTLIPCTLYLGMDVGLRRKLLCKVKNVVENRRM